jgi:MULE transposase domain
MFLHLMALPTLPRVFISDQENALRSAVDALLPDIPQLLCVWHIEKNVLVKAKLAWRDADGKTPQEKEIIAQKRQEFMGRWTQLVYTKTEHEFNVKWAQLLRDYSSQIELCEYLQQYQHPNRYKWAGPWTSLHRHFGTVTSSPIEGMHRVLKEYVMTSQGNSSLSPYR